MEIVTESKLYTMDIKTPFVFVIWGTEAIGVAMDVEGAWDIMEKHAAAMRDIKN